MEINKIEGVKLSNFADEERVFVSIVKTGTKVVIEPFSSNDEDFIDDDGNLDNLGVGEMIRSFEDGSETTEEFFLLVRVR